MAHIIKLCVWCDKNPVSMFGEYDEDSNMCAQCLDNARKRGNRPIFGEWSRNANAEKDAHSADILQPMRKDGTVNPDFVKVHGTKSLKKELKVSDKEIRDNVERYG